MHLRILLPLLFAGFASAASIKCTPYYTGQFLAFTSDFETSVPVGYINGVVDSKGRKIVSLNNNGKPPAPMALTFWQCFSQFMRSGQAFGQAATITYGIATGARHPKKCLTLSSVLKARGPTYVVSSDCQTLDTFGTQLPQWFRLTEQPSARNASVTNRYLNIDGSPNISSSMNLSYGSYTLQAFQSKRDQSQLYGKATFLEYTWSPTAKSDVYTFGMGNPL